MAAAADAKTAGELLRKQQFDAIICDIVLPDGTGYAVMHEARRKGARALGIAMTGYGYPADVEQPKLTGFDYHLMKPVKCEELRSLVEQGRRKHQS